MQSESEQDQSSSTSEARFRLALEHFPGPVAIYDARRRFEFVNTAAVALTGLDPAHLLGRTDEQALDSEMTSRYLPLLEQVMATRQTRTTELEIPTRRGPRSLALTYVPILGQTGELLHIVAFAQDISANRQRERENQALIAVSTALRAALTRAQALAILLEQVSRLLNVRGCAVLAPSLDKHASRVELGYGSLAALTGQRIPAGPALLGSGDSAQHPLLSEQGAEQMREVIRQQAVPIEAVAAVPLLAERRLLGTLLVERAESLPHADVRLLGAVGEIAGAAVQRAMLYEQTERQLKRLDALRAIDKAISSTFDLRVTLEILLDHIMPELNVDAAAVLLLDSNSLQLRYAAGRGFHTAISTQMEVRLGEGLAGRAALERTLAHVPDLTKSSGQHNRQELFAVEGFVGYVAAPLVAKGTIKGLLELFRRSPLSPAAEWFDFMEAVASQAAIAIDNAALFDQMQRHTVDLALAYDATLEGWARALDLRGGNEEEHSHRTADLAVNLGRALGVNAPDLINLRRGALLHQVGQLQVPESILLKREPLTAEQATLYLRQPEFARALLTPVQLLRPALDVPYAWHERWDGTGYPRGLEGEQIPLMARIFAVAHEFQELVAPRPAGAGLAPHAALDSLRARHNSQFDPRVVDELAQVLSGDTTQAAAAAPQVLVVEAEPLAARALARTLRAEFGVLAVGRGSEALYLLERHAIAVVVTAMHLADMSGLQLLKEARLRRPAAQGLIVGAVSEAEAGRVVPGTAYVNGFVPTPWTAEELLAQVSAAVAHYDQIAHEQARESYLR